MKTIPKRKYKKAYTFKKPWRCILLPWYNESWNVWFNDTDYYVNLGVMVNCCVMFWFKLMLQDWNWYYLTLKNLYGFLFRVHPRAFPRKKMVECCWRLLLEIKLECMLCWIKAILQYCSVIKCYKFAPILSEFKRVYRLLFPMKSSGNTCLSYDFRRHSKIPSNFGCC